jgi:hypothetical protein
MSTPAITVAPEASSTIDCPGNYQAPAPTTLRCSKCNRPLAVKDARRTPTGYVCPYFVKARVATLYNATPLQHVVVGLIAIPLGMAAGIALQLASSIPFLGIIATLFVAPIAGGAVPEIVRRIFKKTRGQYFWLAGTIGAIVGASPFVVIPFLLALLGGGFGAIWALIPIIGLGVMVSTMIARMRI